MADSIPDFLMGIFGATGIRPIEPEPELDIEAFEAAVDECRAVFLSRRDEYGDHLLRSPSYFASALHVKMDRAITDIGARRPMKRDTVVDLVNFALMILSRRHAKQMRENDNSGDNHL